MRPDLAPTACLPFEPEEAQRLQWLPLAVRHKLDGCGLRMSLAQWQALPLPVRLGMLQLEDGPQFAEFAAVRGGARPGEPREVPQLSDAATVAQWLACEPDAARRWLAAASPFARYALAKLRKSRRPVLEGESA